ncbi:gamma-tubulin complex component 4-like protein [Cucumis melo var. makuwa]|uniref:Gamma-tubulin complex component n=1 Tax=Cucumis melo var. makuwa TaxID=1194695 RepID=A0A5D3DFQ5_CUCMM|nr:gamma-tubulin complex component 4-like protein [Cucumis melo var. makuwa]
MLHELLLALLGYTGDLIIDEREHYNSLGLNNLLVDAPISGEPTFKLASDISFLEPSERDLIQRIIVLGFYYRELDRFATKSRNLSWIRSGNESSLANSTESSKDKIENPSVYRRAIANGIVEILSIYRSAVLHVEQKLLSETVPILAIVTQGLDKFFVLFPPLHQLIREIERDDIQGGQLLNLLHKRCHCGVPELQTCIQRQDDRETNQGSSVQDMSEKLGRLSTDESLTDWHLGFHIYLVHSLPRLLPIFTGLFPG